MTFQVRMEHGLATLPDVVTERDIAALMVVLRIRAGLPMTEPSSPVPEPQPVEADDAAREFVRSRLHRSPKTAWLRSAAARLWCWKGDEGQLQAAIDDLLASGEAYIPDDNMIQARTDEDDS